MLHGLNTDTHKGTEQSDFVDVPIEFYPWLK